MTTSCIFRYMMVCLIYNSEMCQKGLKWEFYVYVFMVGKVVLIHFSIEALLLFQLLKDSVVLNCWFIDCFLMIVIVSFMQW